MGVCVLALLVRVIDTGLISFQVNIQWHIYRCRNREKEILVNHIQINNLNDKHDGRCIFEGLCHLQTKDFIQIL